MLLLLLAGALAVSALFLMKPSADRPGEEASFFQDAVLRESTLATGSGRIGVWASANRVIQKKPLFGYGFGVTDRLFVTGYFPDLPFDFQGGHCHNSYIEELINLGWVGGSLIFFCVAVTLVTGLIGVARPAGFTASYRLTCALLGVVAAGSVSAFFETWLTSVGSFFCFPYWFAGMLLLKMVRRFNDWQVA